MVAPAAILGAKVIVGKIAEQIAIQAAAELLLRRIMPSRGGSPPENPIADLELSAIMQQIAPILQQGMGGGAPAPRKKGKVSKYNRLFKAEMAKMKKSRMKPRARFKLAAKRASTALKKGKKGRK